MIRYSTIIPSLITTTTMMFCYLPSVVALEPSEIAIKAREFIVQIDGEDEGSGVIIERNGNVYKVLTNWHVVDTQGKYEVITNDGEKHSVNYSQVKYFPGLDLAVIEFSSDKNYALAQLGDSKQITEATTVYLVGYPSPSAGLPSRSYFFMPSVVISLPSNPDRGYGIVYNSSLTAGSSGGGILNSQAQLIGINGRSYYDVNTGVTYGQGIPLQLYQKAINTIASPPQNSSPEDDLITLGRKKAKQEDYQGAIALYTQAITQNYNTYEAYYERAKNYYQLGKYQEAIQDLNEILKSNLKDSFAYFNRGNIYVKFKNYSQAIEDYSQAIKNNQYFAQAYSNRGFMYIQEENYQEAIEDFNEAIRLEPTLANAYLGRGGAYRMLGDTSKALSDLNEAAKLFQQQKQEDKYQSTLKLIKDLESR